LRKRASFSRHEVHKGSALDRGGEREAPPKGNYKYFGRFTWAYSGNPTFSFRDGLGNLDNMEQFLSDKLP
jgi:hypothetical protein